MVLLVFLLRPWKESGLRVATEALEGLVPRDWDAGGLDVCLWDVCLPARVRACVCVQRDQKAEGTER